MGTPTTRSKKLLEDAGYTVAVVERWNPHVRIRQDLWGFADLLAMKPGAAPILVQTTSGANTASRITKIKDEPRAAIACRSGFRIEVHGWRKLKSNRNRWTPKIQELTEADLPCPLPPSCEPQA